MKYVEYKKWFIKIRIGNEYENASLREDIIEICEECTPYEIYHALKPHIEYLNMEDAKRILESCNREIKVRDKHVTLRTTQFAGKQTEETIKVYQCPVEGTSTLYTYGHIECPICHTKMSTYLSNRIIIRKSDEEIDTNILESRVIAKCINEHCQAILEPIGRYIYTIYDYRDLKDSEYINPVIRDRIIKFLREGEFIQ